MKYAIIKDNKIAEYREYPELPEGIKHLNGLPMLRPVRTIAVAGYDPMVHNKTVSVQIFDAEVVETEGLEAKTAAQISAQTKVKIDELERRQGRVVREAILGLPGAVDRLTALNNDVAALRTKLV